MPELPEVETVVRTLRPLVVGRKILSVDFCSTGRGGLGPSAIRRLISDSPHKFRGALCGALIEEVERFGKNIVLRLDSRNGSGKGRAGALWVHLGMTGRLTCEGTAEPRARHTHLVLELDEPGRWIHFADIRRFGRLRIAAGRFEQGDKLGPDPLEISFEGFQARLKIRRTMLKSLLLDQRFLRGIGNIYADESLFRAGLHPRALAARLSRKQVRALYEAIRETLRLAIQFCGSSISNYVDGQGRRGSFQRLHQVYRRTGQPCLRCGTPIERIVVASRSTHFCPGCQPKGVCVTTPPKGPQRLKPQGRAVDLTRLT
ncbi:MAG: bifunctional DNA-formamidopyrimidine glycosylase/DNA-(apurinic or apyrimidinic site) lyase, partial [Acidobacteria bacterium]|nr:bifunctional DNA-formamidopyrimidine glycosylase/DNA-(apurinic or apyrimidinic site) lyase [Acidobacteriota bacterium]